MDPLKCDFNISNIDNNNYLLKKKLYTNYGFGMFKGISFNKNDLKYLFVSVFLQEPILLKDKKISLKIDDTCLYSFEIKYPKKIFKFHDRFFLNNPNRYYTNEVLSKNLPNQISYDNGNIFINLINIRNIYHISNIVFRIDISKFELFNIKKFSDKFYDVEKCVACLDKMAIIKIKPCNHICLCYECYPKLEIPKCPLCNTYISDISQ